MSSHLDITYTQIIIIAMNPALTISTEEIINMLAILPKEVEGLRVVEIYRLRHVDDEEITLQCFRKVRGTD